MCIGTLRSDNILDYILPGNSFLALYRLMGGRLINIAMRLPLFCYDGLLLPLIGAIKIMVE